MKKKEQMKKDETLHATHSLRFFSHSSFFHSVKLCMLLDLVLWEVAKIRNQLKTRYWKNFFGGRNLKSFLKEKIVNFKFYFIFILDWDFKKGIQILLLLQMISVTNGGLHSADITPA